MKRTYLTSKRLASIAVELSPRDWAIITDVGRLRLLSGAQLATLHFGTEESDRRLARQVLARLVERRVLVRLGRRVGGVRAGSSGFVYGLDVAGVRLLDPGRRRAWPTVQPGEQFLRHVLAVAQIYVHLRSAEKTGGFELLHFDAEPACWRSFVGPGGGRLVLKPDAYVVTAAGGYEDHVFVEVDLATETGPRIVDKARRYIDYFHSGREQARSAVFPQVLFLVPDGRRQGQVVGALGRVDADCWPLFVVRTLSDAVEAITGLDVDASPGWEVQS